MLVFGKGFRMPGSLTSDDQLTAHLTASEETAQGIRFRQQLAFRETARRAFVAADNSIYAVLRSDGTDHRVASMNQESGSWFGEPTPQQRVG